MACQEIYLVCGETKSHQNLVEETIMATITGLAEIMAFLTAIGAAGDLSTRAGTLAVTLQATLNTNKAFDRREALLFMEVMSEYGNALRKGAAV